MSKLLFALALIVLLGLGVGTAIGFGTRIAALEEYDAVVEDEFGMLGDEYAEDDGPSYFSNTLICTWSDQDPSPVCAPLRPTVRYDDQNECSWYEWNRVQQIAQGLPEGSHVAGRVRCEIEYDA